MKRINLIYCLFLVTVFIGCIDDKGNYKYLPDDEFFPVTVEGLPTDSSYLLLSDVVVKPIITGLPKAESEYDFIWYTYPVGAAGYIPERDTVGLEKNLSFQIRYAPGLKYNLFLVIRDKETEWEAFCGGGTIWSASIYSSGYYITKDINNETNIDYINSNEELMENVLTSFLDEPLKGKAVQTLFQSNRYTHVIANPDGSLTTLSNQAVMYVLSEQDGCIMEANNFKVFKRLDDWFYAIPEVRKPTDIQKKGSSTDVYLIHNGGFHSINCMSPNFGIFSASRQDYENLFPKFIFSINPSSAMCFDEVDRTFCYTGQYDAVMRTFNEPPAASNIKIQTTKMDVNVLCLLDRTPGLRATSSQGFAVMKNKDKEEYYLADINFLGNATYPFVDLDTLGATRKLPYADVFAAHKATPCLYFAKDNILSYYFKNESDDTSIEEYAYHTFETGETITFIEHLLTNDLDELNVLTIKDGKWKFYRFPVESGTPRLDKTEVKVYSGTGNARHVMKR